MNKLSDELYPLVEFINMPHIKEMPFRQNFRNIYE